jgi:restriction endonuclease S subunit
MSVNSIILKSNLEGAHRIDAEYYQPEYLLIEKTLKSLSHKTLQDISESIVSFGAYALTNLIEWQEGGIPFIVAENIKDGYIDYESARYVSNKTDEILKKSRIKEGQVLLSMSGSVGNSALAYNIPQRLNSNQDILKIKLNKECSPALLTVFLNSKYGKMQVLRLPVGSVQQHIFLWQVKTILVPTFKEKFKSNIEKIYLEGLIQLEKSKLFYSQAESLLLVELGLKDFKPEDELYYVVNLSEAKSVHRVDSEYFQPKYNKLLSKIKDYEKQPFHYFVKSYGTGYPFESDNYQADGIPLIRINNIKKSLLDLSDTVFLSEDDFNLAPKEIANSGDIVLGMSGTIGFAAIIPEDVPRCSINQRILHFTPQNAEPLYVLVLLNSIVGNIQLQRIGTGGVQTNISYRDIKNISIPSLSNGKQQKIADLVRQSHEARKKAKELLDEAKRKVEEEIEKGDN